MKLPAFFRTSLSTLAFATVLFSGALCASPVSDSLKGELVTCHDKQLQPFDDSKLSGVKIFAFYYSAHWCPPCRAFTPKLVQFYNHMKKEHPEFELVFLSHDKSRDAMIEYMDVMKMPWVATEFGKGGAIRKYSTRGIPCLVVVDDAGKVLADSYEGEKYVGPQKAMHDLDRLLTKATTGNGGSSDFDAFFHKNTNQTTR